MVGLFHTFRRMLIHQFQVFIPSVSRPLPLLQSVASILPIPSPLPHLQLLLVKVAEPLQGNHLIEAIQEGFGLLLHPTGEPPVCEQAGGKKEWLDFMVFIFCKMLSLMKQLFFSVSSSKEATCAQANLPDVLLFVFLSDQLVLSIILQLVSGNFPEDLHVLCKVQLHATLLQVVFSGHTHRNAYIIVPKLTYAHSHTLISTVSIFEGCLSFKNLKKKNGTLLIISLHIVYM